MSLAVLHSRALAGMDAPEVTVEVHLSGGLPSFTIVGLPEAEVKEARDRVRAALVNARFEFPARRLTVNLAPADLPKESGRFDLPIALGILAASGQLPANRLEEYEFAGELSLTGDLRPIRGALAMTYKAHRCGRAFVLPRASADGGEPGARRANPAGENAARGMRAPGREGEPAALRRGSRGRGAARLPRSRRCQRPGARQARAGNRGRRRAQPAHGGTARHRQVHAGGALSRDTSADERQPRRWNRRRCNRWARAGFASSSSAAGRFARRTTRPPAWPWSAAAAIRARARFRSPITACCSWTNCPNSSAGCWKCCASRWSPGAWRFRARRARRNSPRVSS